MTTSTDVSEYRSDQKQGLQVKENGKWRTVASYIDLHGVAHEEGSEEQLLVIRFATGHGVREHLHPRADRVKPSAILMALVGRGYNPPRAKADRKILCDFLTHSPVQFPFVIVRRTGYYDRAYVRGDGAVIPAEAGTGIIFRKAGSEHLEPPHIAGTLEGWTEQVSIPAQYSYPMMFGISVSFATFLMKFVGEESAMFHLFGRSSVGKSLIQLVSTTVHRHTARDQLPHWDVTNAGLEELAAEHCDALLVLDDTGHLSKDSSSAAAMARAAAYKLTSGKGRIRSSFFKGGVDLRWRLLGLSSGESPIESYSLESGGRLAGEAVRLIDVPVVVNDEHGIFHQLPDGVAAHDLAARIEAGCERHAGMAAVRFVEKLYRIPENEVAGLIHRWMREFVDTAAVPTNGWERRFARRFALAYAGARFARRFKIVRWRKSECLTACTNAYVSARLHVAARDTALADAIAKVRDRLRKSTHKVDLTSREKREAVTKQQVKKASAFIVRDGRRGKFYVLPARTLLRWTKGAVSLSVLVMRLKELGHLVTDEKAPTRQVKVPHRRERRRYYCLAEAFLARR